jgi:GNAT superfamily N-acetyltransferase
MPADPLAGVFGGAATATAAPPTPAPTPQPKDDPLAHVFSAPTPEAGSTPPPHSSSADLFGGAVGQVGTTVGWALNAQHEAALQKAFGGGSVDENRKRLREWLGIESDYENPKLFGVVPQPGAATQMERGIVDAALDTLTDPLSYETLGIGPALKYTGIGEKMAPLADKAGKWAMNTPLGAEIYDKLHWGGDIARERGGAFVDSLRGASGRAGATGSMVTKRFQEMSDTIIGRLNDRQKIKIGKALNGDIPTPLEDPKDFSPRERTAYLQLRRLTELDYKIRRDAARGEVFATYTQGMDAADKAQLQAAIKAGKEPVVPKPAPQQKVQPGNTPYEIKSPDLKRVESDGDPNVYSPGFQKSAGREGPVKRYDYYQGKDHIGFVEVSFPKGQPPHIEHLETMQSARRQGYGAQMLSDVGQQLRALGHSQVTATPINDAAEALNAKVWGDPVERATRYERTADVHNIDRDAEPKPTTTAYKTPEGKLTHKAFDKEPANQAEIDRATKLRDAYRDIMFAVEKRAPYRESYMPGVHTGEETTGKAARKIEPGHYDPRTIQREDIHIEKPGQLSEGFNAMAINTGHQVRSRVLHETLGDLIDDPKIHELMSKMIPATGDARTNLEKVKDAWLAIVGYPRAATVSITPRHAMNILDLASNTVPVTNQPQFFKNVTILVGKLMTANASKYAKLTKEGRELGALSGDVNENRAFFNRPWQLPVTEKIGLAQWSKLMNKLTWAVDTAAKQEYAKLLVQNGEATGLEAGGKAAKRLVDYENVPPIVKALRYVAPFGSFRGQIPGAVLGGIVRSPVRAALNNRLSGGTAYGGQPEPGAHGMTMYNPTADVARGIDSPENYLRGTLGAPAQALGTLAGELFAGAPGQSLRDIGGELRDAPGLIARHDWDNLARPEKPTGRGAYAEIVKMRLARYLNYGNAIDLRWIANAAAAGIPEARATMEQLDLGQFSPRQGGPAQQTEEEILQQALGIGVK